MSTGAEVGGTEPAAVVPAPFGADPASLVELVEWLIDSHEINVTMCGATEAWVSINEEERVLPERLAPLLCKIAAGHMWRKANNETADPARRVEWHVRVCRICGESAWIAIAGEAPYTTARLLCEVAERKDEE